MSWKLHINDNHLDPRLQEIVNILDNRKRNKNWFAEVMDKVNAIKEYYANDPEQWDHALQDITYTIERRMR